VNNEVVSTLGNRAFITRQRRPVATRDSRPLIEIKRPQCAVRDLARTVHAVEDLSYSVHPGEMVAIVGESGSASRYLPWRSCSCCRPAPPASPRLVRFDGRELLQLSTRRCAYPRRRDRHDLRSDDVALNGVADRLQIMEPATIHLGMDDGQARTRPSSS